MKHNKHFKTCPKTGAIKRRDFIKASLISAGAFALNPFPHHLYASETKKYGTDQIILGNTGIKLSRLAMGTGTHGVNRQSNQTRKLGVKGVSELLSFVSESLSVVSELY